MSSKYQSLLRLLLLAAVIGSGADRAAAQWHYYYFKEKKPLPLDLTRVVVQLADADGAAASFSSLTKYGLDDDAVEPAVLRNWFFIQTASASTTVDQVEQLVVQASTDPSVVFVSPVFVGPYGPVAITPTLFVGFRSDVGNAQAEAILRKLDAGEILDRDWSRMKGVYRLRSTFRNGFDVLATANRLAERPEVKFAEPDRLITGTNNLIPNDPGFLDPGAWGLHNTGQIGPACPDSPAGTVDMDMDAPEAWDITTGDPGVVVVIIDTGIQQDHADLNQLPGMDFTGTGSGGGPFNECDGHGTLVGGCVAAKLNNALGTVGVAPSCKVVSAKWGVSSVPCTGSFSAALSWLIDSLDWAQSIGARVTNSSFGMGESAIVDTKYTETHNAGVLHFAAAGNGGFGSIGYPASIPKVQAVAALQRNGNLANFSQYGPGLQFSAPGCAIYTTAVGPEGGAYNTVNGTSFATPYTCGVAALVISVDPTLTPPDVLAIMQASAVDLGDPGYDTQFGWGFVNAHQAVMAASRPVQACTLEELTAQTATDGDRYGSAVSLDGELLVTGAPFADSEFVAGAGVGYVYGFDGESWSGETKLSADDGVDGDEFGNAVAIHDEVVVVGAHRVGDAGFNSGAAYVFRWDGATWQQEQKLTAKDASANDFFGAAVAIDGDVAAIGAFFDDCEDASLDCGSVYVFRYNGANWIEEEKLVGSDTTTSDLFGAAIALRGDVLLVGSPNADCDAGANCGAAYRFQHNGKDWVEEERLTASDAAPFDLFGSSAALAGDVMALGAPGTECQSGSADCGAAYVFRQDGAVWQERKLRALDEHADDTFGESVTVADDVLVVGAGGDDCGGGALSCGAAYVFRRDRTEWFEQVKLFSPNPGNNERFGAVLSLDTGVVAVGASRVGCLDGTNCGAAYLYPVAGDCNENGTDDDCDLLAGTSSDLDFDGIPDECVCLTTRMPLPDVRGIKNRYLSFTPRSADSAFAVRVSFIDLPAPFDIWNGTELWAGPPFQVSENGGTLLPIPAAATFEAAMLQCEPYFTNWGTLGAVHLFHEGIVPNGTYQIELLDATCPVAFDAGYSPPLDITTSRWGDTVEDCSAFPCGAPDGFINIVDITALIARFVSEPEAIIKARADLEPACVDLLVNISDAQHALSGFQGLPYPFTPSTADPCDSPCMSPMQR